MRNILKYLFDPQPRRGWKIIIVGMLIFIVFINTYGYLLDGGYISKNQGLVLFWMAILGWLLGVIGVVNHFRWFFSSRSNNVETDEPRQSKKTEDDK